MLGKPEAFIIDLDSGNCLFMGTFNAATIEFDAKHAASEKWVALIDGRGSGTKRMTARVNTEPPKSKKKAATGGKSKAAAG